MLIAAQLQFTFQAAQLKPATPAALARADILPTQQETASAQPAVLTPIPERCRPMHITPLQPVRLAA